jgi:hypothetical protein
MTNIQQLLSADCPVCGREAVGRVVGYEFGLDVAPGTDLTTCTMRPQDRDQPGGAVYLHLGGGSDD